MRELKYYVACTVDGFIAAPDGSFVFSRSMKEAPDAAVELVPGEGGQNIWLCGGGELASVLSEEIDELILKLNPLLLGRGIPRFAGAIRPRSLQLASSSVYGNGVAVLRYR